MTVDNGILQGATMRSLLLCLGLLATPAAAQIDTALKLADVALNLRGAEIGSAEQASLAADLGRQIDQVIDRQISAPEMAGLLDARLDAFEMRRMARAVTGAGLRFETCRDLPGACAGELAELDRLLRQLSSEIAAAPPGAVTLGLLERARGLHLAVLDAAGASPQDRALIAALYARYYAALGSAAPGSASEIARGDLIARLAEQIGVPAAELELGHHAAREPLIDELLAEQGGAILLSGLRAYFDGGVRFLDAQSRLGAAAVQVNCRLNRDRPGVLDGLVSPLRLPTPLEALIEDEESLRFPGTPVQGADYEVIWLQAAIARDGAEVRVEASEAALVDDAARRFAIPYGRDFYTRGATEEPASLPYRGATTEAELLARLGVYPWAPGPCLLTDGVGLSDAQSGLGALEATLTCRGEDIEDVLAALVELERLRSLADRLGTG